MFVPWFRKVLNAQVKVFCAKEAYLVLLEELLATGHPMSGRSRGGIFCDLSLLGVHNSTLT